MRDFFKYTFATLVGLILFVTLGFGGLLFLILAAASRDTSSQIKDKSVLVLDLSLEVQDGRASSDRLLEEALSGDRKKALSLQTTVAALERAAKDSRIVGLYLYGNDGSGGETGLATLQEMRRALEKFRASGKPIIAYDVEWGEREYYLGSVANTVILNPIGAMEFNGFRSENIFFAQALQKYGIGIQVTRVGKYKAAVEPLLLSRGSQENREQTSQLLGDLWSDFLTVVGKQRKLNPRELQEIADSQAILMPEEALDRRLIDRVAYFDEVVKDLKKLTGDEADKPSFRQISLKAYADAVDATLAANQKSKNEIAVVYAEGELVDGQGSSGEIGGDRLARQLRRLRMDKDVKAVVLRVNSPGGSVTASDVVQREVVLYRGVKPLVVSMGNYAASGGYWISTYADRIFAEPNTVTGSIGVFGILPNIQRLANNNGITWDVVKTARFADSGTLSRPKTPEELAINQRMVNQIYDRFLAKVAESRKLPKVKVAAIAEGRVWSGRQAKQLGLVDELGGLEMALQEAAKLAKLGNDWRLEEYPKTRSLEERLLGNLAAIRTHDQTDPFVAEYKKFREELKILTTLNDPLNLYVRLPYNLEID